MYSLIVSAHYSMRSCARCAFWNFSLTSSPAVAYLGTFIISLRLFVAICLVAYSLTVIAPRRTYTRFKYPNVCWFAAHSKESVSQKSLGFRPLCEEQYHRSVRFAELTGTQPGEFSYLYIVAVVQSCHGFLFYFPVRLEDRVGSHVVNFDWVELVSEDPGSLYCRSSRCLLYRL